MAPLELESQMVEAAADHGWYLGESCSRMTPVVVTGPQDSLMERSWNFVCVEMVKVKFGKGSLWSCPTKRAWVVENAYVTLLEGLAGHHINCRLPCSQLPVIQ